MWFVSSSKSQMKHVGRIIEETKMFCNWQQAGGVENR